MLVHWILSVWHGGAVRTYGPTTLVVVIQYIDVESVDADDCIIVKNIALVISFYTSFAKSSFYDGNSYVKK